MGDQPIKVILVDDHEIVREGLRRVLESSGIVEVVGEADRVGRARTVLEETEPDVAVIDVVLPDGDGIQLCREIRSKHPDVACLLLTSFPDDQAVLAASMAGAAGYLVKEAGTSDIVEAVRVAAEGGTLLDRQAVEEKLDALRSRSPEDERLGELTPQEKQVFELIGHGLTNRQIGERMYLAETTVRNYVSRLLSKLDMDRRTEAAALAARLAERRAHQRGRRYGGS